jgi:hypothetical protein
MLQEEEEVTMKVNRGTLLRIIQNRCNPHSILNVTVER